MGVCVPGRRLQPRSTVRLFQLLLIALASLLVTFGVHGAPKGAFAFGGYQRNTKQLGSALSAYMDVDAPWPKFGANLQNTCQGVGSGADGLEKWRFQTEDSIYSSPVIGSNGNIYFGSDDGCLYALDSNGNYLWSYQTQAPVRSTPLIGVGTIFVVSEDGSLYAVNSSTGHLKWHYPFSTQGSLDYPPSMSPNGLLYFACDPYLYAINSVTGHLVWKVNYAWNSTALAVDPVHGTVYINVRTGTTTFALVAYSEAGVAEWAYDLPDGNFVEECPTLGPNGTIYFATEEGTLVALQDNFNGTYTKLFETPMDLNPDEPMALSSNGILYTNTGEAYSATTGDLLWTFRAGSGLMNSPAVSSDGTVYFFSDFGILYALNGTTGEEEWEVFVGPFIAQDPRSYPFDSSPAVGADGTVYFGAADGQMHAIGQAQILAVQLGTNTIIGGYDSTGAVQLTGIVGNLASKNSSGADVVTLSSDTPAVLTVPSQVSIPTGYSEISFPISTSLVSEVETVTVTATIGSSSQTATMFVTPSPVYSISSAASEVYGGEPTTGTIKLKGSAGPQGAAIVVVANNNNVSLPSVTVAAGETSTTFTINSLPVSASQQVKLTATYGGAAVTTVITISPYPLTSISTNVTTAYGGQSLTGTVKIAGDAGPQGSTVTLSSSSTLVKVPASVLIGAAKTSATFTPVCSPVSFDTSVTLTAKNWLITKTTQLTLVPAPLSSLKVAASQLVGGVSGTGTVTLNALAGPSGDKINLSSDSGFVKVPSSITVPANATSASFTIETTGVNAATAATVTATFGSSTKTASLTLEPASISSFSVSPTSVVGGSNSEATLLFTGQLGSNGAVVHFTSDSSLVSVPSSVTLASADSVYHFVVKTKATTATVVAHLTASWGGITKTATLTLTR